MTSSITYEYRIWPSDILSVIMLMRAHMDTRHVEERIDTYFVGSGNEWLLPKIRGENRFEIKALVGHDEDGEIWRRALSEPFPLRRPTVEKLSCLFGPLEDDSKTIRTCWGLHHALPAHVTAIPVKKRRFLLGTDDCRGELTEVTVDRKPFVTAAIECDDAETFRDMVSRLALTRWPNRNYGMWLRSRMQECSA